MSGCDRELALRELAEVVREYLIEMEHDNPCPDYSYRQALRRRMTDKLERVGEGKP